MQYLQGLLALTNPESKHYEKFLNAFSPEPMLITKALNGEKLSIGDIAVVKELMQTNIAEYMMKGEYQRCCYSATEPCGDGVPVDEEEIVKRI